MAKKDSKVQEDLFEIVFTQQPSDGVMRVSTALDKSLTEAIARGLRFMARERSRGTEFPGVDVWLVSRLVFTLGDGEGKDSSLWELMAGAVDRFYPRAPGDYSYDEKLRVWQLVSVTA
ncbi:MAG TPA: hypothetical protein VGM74_20295 [Burkholderiaceae bacterium]|jgi:hypothetical protein